MTDVKSFSKFKKTKIICRNTMLCVSNLVFVFCFIAIEESAWAQNCPGPTGIWKKFTLITPGGQSISTFNPCGDFSGDHRLGIGTQSALKKVHVLTKHIVQESHAGIRLEDQLFKPDFTEVARSIWDLEPGFFGGRARFKINVIGGGTLKTVLTLTDTGNVGIGTTNPTGILHIVQGDINRFRIGTGGDIQTEGANGTGWNNFGAANALFPILTVQNNLKSEVMRVTSAGNVGIGTENPERQLHVRGGDGAAIIDAAGLGTDPALWLTHDNFSSKFNNGILASRGDESVYIRANGVTAATFKNGKIGIGTIVPNAKLTINILNFNDKAFTVTDAGVDIFRIDGTGRVWSKRTTVQSPPFPDYVFEKNYRIQSILEFKKYIYKNKRLPGMPSANEVEKNGLDLGEVSVKLIENVEVLGLYVVELYEKMQKLEMENADLKERMASYIEDNR